ncbi:MAG: hypothetical protein Q4C95_00165 [Planctomycetia bacterium]|nr:hypothetical protein [Planctomycetia bacterium]
MSSVLNNRREFLKWLGLSSVSAFNLVSGMKKDVLGSSNELSSFLSKDDPFVLFHSFLKEDVCEIVHYSYCHFPTIEPETRALFQIQWREIAEKTAQLKNQSLTKMENHSIDCCTIILSDGTKLIYHLRLSPLSNQMKNLTFFNGRKQLAIASQKETEWGLTLYRNKSCCSETISFQERLKADQFHQARNFPFFD